MDNSKNQDNSGGGDASVDVTTQKPSIESTDLFSFNPKAIIPFIKELKHIGLLKLIVLCFTGVIALVLSNGFTLERTTITEGHVKSSETLTYQPFGQLKNSVKNE